ncbi:MAG TPA: TlpA disulfide reductase family protein [Caldisericia bacterium]|nr:TlpA disulfide reductase family protein [Caldisericia bacterium]HPF49496.1 TlpA disulfide reductase family protein [Caldisericia bacterium]HPI84210.1 TlpA disulfide reductase family protein [Caldisericia bacterium]HPQ93495.1 TlpA disulfide reductase family protein [Caldisericia bacterium]HRV75499.1 TlpA disulfide reductase family protein [Caldisericia bacterium]
MKKLSVVVIVVLLLIIGCSSASKLPAVSPIDINMSVLNGIGESYGDITTFTWENPDGTTGEFKPVENTLLVFWRYNCEVCTNEISAIQEYYKETGASIVLISMNDLDTIEYCIDCFDRKEATFPIVADPTQELTKYYDISTIPDSMVVDGNGKILARKKATLYREVLEKLLEEAR